MKFCEIIQHIENIAPLCFAAPWDHSGIQVAAKRALVTHLAVMLDPAPDLMERALQSGADAVLSHHPLAITPRLPDRLDNLHAALCLLLKNDVPLYSAHTSLDANPLGPAAWLADAFCLRNRRILERNARQNAEVTEHGFGFFGHLPHALSYDAFCEKLRAVTGKTSWRASGPQTREITCMAYCPGAGESLIHAAANLNADIYITGDVKYHAAVDAPIRVLDVGHFIMEETMMRLFADSLRDICKTITVSFVDSQDPFMHEGDFGLSR
ncbi:hypothetical protein FACS1894206_01340 [Deltaproteobacteria bacterium]|nr:hypothetical protein FACS1894206_01340 [Deltaproteobacteria bacterium]